MIGDFHFIRPLVLLLLPVGFAVAYMLRNKSVSTSNWSRVCDAHLLPHLLTGKRAGNRQIPYILLLLAWLIATISAAGPTWQRLPQPVHDTLLGRVLVFDLSLSMKSTDVSPDRLSRARFKLMDLIQTGVGIQQGLVVFAGDAFVVVPVTDDIDTLTNLVPSLDTRTVPVQGSRADLGIDSAVTLLKNTGFQIGSIILITDGVVDGAAESAARAASQGFEVSVLAVGTAAGAPIPLHQGALLKDQKGNIVIPGVNHDRLRTVASMGSGKYTVLTADDTDVQLLNGRSPLDIELDTGKSGQRLAANPETDQYRTDQWIDRGPWLLVPLLLLSALGFRRGWILMFCFTVIPATVPEDALAFGWDDLWLRDDQQAAKLYHAEKFDQLDENAPPQWLGASRYRNEDYAGASESFLQGDTGNATTHYNAGNALARSFALEQALAAYDLALELDPEMTDARENRELVKQMLEQQKQQNQNSDNSESSEDQQKQDTEQSRRDAENSQQDNSGEGENQERGEESKKNSGDSKTEQADSRQNLKEQNNEDDESQGSNTTQEVDLGDQTMDEKQQALEQWLKRIPDDPGGLLRRKFARQYSLRDTPRSDQQW